MQTRSFPNDFNRILREMFEGSIWLRGSKTEVSEKIPEVQIKVLSFACYPIIKYLNLIEKF